jgi:RNA recognition motif-containing protein
MIDSDKEGSSVLKKLYVGNLPYQATDEDVQNMFTQAGITVDSVTLMRDKFSGEARGFGFVQVADGDMDRAIAACNGKPLHGRPLVVNEARPAPSGGERRGAGGGQGRGERRGGGAGGWR